MLNTPEGTLSQLAALMGDICGTNISPQGLDERINSRGAEFLKLCLEKAMKLSCRPFALNNDLLTKFDHIYIIDSTNFDLQASLKDIFKGSNGSASKSCMRIQFAYDYLQGKTYVEIGDVKLSDAGTLNRIVSTEKLNIKGECIFLSDLGYFKLDTFSRINENQGQFFLSKLKYGVNILDENDNKIDLQKLLKRGVKSINMKVKIGDFECRLVGQKLPKKVLNEKLRNVITANKKKRRTISKEYKLFITYGLFITNLTDDFSFESLYTLYRLRWQIELIFKTWKSILKIHYVYSGKEARVLCQIYGKLIVAVLANNVYLNVQSFAKQNLSFHRVLQYIKSIVVIWTLSIFKSRTAHRNFLSNMRHKIKRLCIKRNQKDRPTIELLLESI